ncbi:MAG: TonB-dependent receptor [Bacteroidales bacterium]|jgi:outer membrane receptor for ferrienterochelin and colicin|nr:TonB-dependent receptor plug domain-containing protein [Bacteroidota bacterium]NLO00627.1 TonB-dependent receptor [Bacteroidales bacterium]
MTEKLLFWGSTLLILTLMLVSGFFSDTAAQERRVTVSGYISDAASGETLIGAGVKSGPLGAVSNNYGFYTLTRPRGEQIELTYSYVGYEGATVVLDLARDTTLNVSLKANARINEAVVAARREAGIQATKMSAVEIPMNLIKNTPTLFGEADVLKTIQLMPGVQSGVEGFSGIHVRGGGPEENLLLLDGIPLYNTEHLLGLFSIFQPEAVKKVTLFKGSFPARYGGRTSSIIDVRTNDGNMQETHGTIGVGLLSDKFHLEGPIFKGKTSYSISARGMHTLLFDRALAMFKIPANYFFYDLNGKLTQKFGDRDRLFLNVYNGKDAFYYKDRGNITLLENVSWDNKTRINWGNTLASLRWNHVFNGRLFANATGAWTRYRMIMEYSASEKDHSTAPPGHYNYLFDYRSGLEDVTGKIDFDYTPGPRHQVKFGVEYIYHTYVPETLTHVEHESSAGKTLLDTTFTNTKKGNRYGHEISFYAEDDFMIGNRLTLNPGIRLAMFVTSGRRYLAPEPRMSAKIDFGRGFSAKAAYSRMSQYVHLLSSSQITLPIDLWVPITKDIKPVTADQYSAGFYYDGLRGWEFSVEGYWKQMDNVLEYKDGISFLANSNQWEDKVEMGEGRAFGVELFVQKTMGKTTGWLGYTLAKSDRIFPSGMINNGRRYPYRYDRRHNVSLVANHKFSEKVDLSGTWTFATGGTTTIPERETAVLTPDGRVVQVDYAPHRNNYRLPPSHRLNLAVNFHRPHKRGESIWSLSIYNVYCRMNPNFVFSGYERNYDGEVYSRNDKLTQLTLLPFIPSFSYTRNF